MRTCTAHAPARPLQDHTQTSAARPLPHHTQTSAAPIPPAHLQRLVCPQVGAHGRRDERVGPVDAEPQGHHKQDVVAERHVAVRAVQPQERHARQRKARGDERRRARLVRQVARHDAACDAADVEEDREVARLLRRQHAALWQEKGAAARGCL
eukprot:237960-Chlamydomonas_euryale.AAC.1